jgi:hypothetical protein
MTPKQFLLWLLFAALVNRVLQRWLRKWVPEDWQFEIGRAAIGVIVAAILGGIGTGVWWLWPSEPSVTGEARIRRKFVQVVKKDANPMSPPWPVVNVYYDNAGTAPAESVVLHYGVGLAVGNVPDERFRKEQDALLALPTWDTEMKGKENTFLHPGDPGQFTSIPPSRDDGFAADFERMFDAVEKGEATILIILVWKYRDPTGTRVTEDCFWMSGGEFRATQLWTPAHIS